MQRSEIHELFSPLYFSKPKFGHFIHFSKVFLCEKEKLKELTSSKVFVNTRNEVISIGRLYVFFTAFLGFTPNSDEGKVEALAAYGSTKNNQLYDYLISSTSISENNQIIINEDVIDYLEKNKPPAQRLASH